MIGHWWVDPSELDDPQKKAIGLPFKGNFLITGPPGSGKTNLLVLRTTNLIRKSITNVILLVFNRTLEEFIANCPTGYGVPREKLKTIMRWEMELICQLGGRPSDEGDITQKRRDNCSIINELLDYQSIGRLYDVILVDECQDCLPEEIKLFLRLANNIFAAGDANQLIYDHPNPLTDMAKDCTVHNLPFHYRNGNEICKLADEIGNTWRNYTALLGTSQYNERKMPSSVNTIFCETIEEQALVIVDNVRLQLKAYPGEMIGVLCPRHKELEVVVDAFHGVEFESEIVFQSADSDQGYLPFNTTTRVCISTLHSSKGLEFRAAHIAGLEWISKFRERQIRMSYTAVTRAKTRLYLYHSAPLPSYMDGALSAIAPKSGNPVTLDDLFKAK